MTSTSEPIRPRLDTNVDLRRIVEQFKVDTGDHGRTRAASHAAGGR